MLTQRLSLTAQDARKVNVTKLHDLGSVAETADGRVFRYSRAGAVDLAAGKFTTSAAKVSNHTNNAVAAAAAVGDRSVSITLAGATATTAGQYDDGFLVVNDTVGAGQALRIEGTPVIASSGTGSIFLSEGVATALTTSSKASLVPNPWDSSIISASAVALFCNGAPNVAVTAAYYYWSQTAGIASVLSDGVIGKGSGAILSDAVNGAVEVEVAGTVTQRVGTAPEATVDAKYYPIYLTLE
jgi:hypothetical protein